MRRGRHVLRVDTFPFLAVLLCAMGSLILVLLVMDRKARRAAQAKAQELARQQIKEHLEVLARHRAEAEQRRQALRQASEKKRESLKARLLAEEKAVEAELAQVRGRLAEAVRQLRQEEDAVEQLRSRLTAQREQLAGKEAQNLAARREAEQAAARATETVGVKSQLASELARLEEKLTELRKARERATRTYSVVPYHGKRGESRRPLYIECDGAGLTFHPDKHRLNPSVNATAVRAEVERRLAEQQQQKGQGGAEAQPYLLLLVRPDGIPRYYELQAAVRGLGVEFGYEFVDADWVLQFPAEAAPASPAASVAAVRPPSKRAVPAGLSASVGMSRPQPYGSDQGTAPAPARSAPPPHPDAPVPGAVLLDPGKFPVLQSAEHRAGGSGGSPLPKPAAAAESILPGNPLPSGGPATSASAQPSEQRSDNPRSTNITANNGSGKGVNAPPNGVRTPETPAKRPAMMRPAALSDGSEYMVFIECQRDRVLIHPGRRMVAIESLNHSPAHNPLYQMVRKLIQQRLSIVPPGGQPPRVQVRFLVHPDAEQTFHLTYPALDALRVSKTRYSLQPEDDVGRIVAGL